MSKRSVRCPWILSAVALLLLYLPTACNSFCFTNRLTSNPTTRPCIVTYGPITGIPLRLPLHATDGGDSSWSPFDDGTPRTPRSMPPQNAASDDQSLTPFEDGSARVPKSPQQITTSEPTPTVRPDSLVASLTRIDPGTADIPTRNIPFLGEIPRDGTLLLIAPVVLIAVLGFVLTIYIGFTSRDLISEEIRAVTTNISAPPVTESVVKSGCRGLCSNQGESLEYLRGVMEGMKNVNQ